MRNSTHPMLHKFVVCCTAAAAWISLLASASHAGPIEAVKGKHYRLSSQHGPWMIMVASFRDVESKRVERVNGRLQYVRNERYEEGLSAEEAATALALELRIAGIPAYVTSREASYEKTNTADRRGRERARTYRSQVDGVAVMAGNYPTFEDSDGQQTLKYLKSSKFRSKVLESPKSGGVYRSTPGQKDPLSGAFLTLNPMLSGEQMRAQTSDPLLSRLNGSAEYSLAKNPGKYTLIIASFNGRSMKKMSNNSFSRYAQSFERTIGNTLASAADKAWQLTQAMRNARGAGYDQDYEVFIWHGHYRSIVTIGAFDDPKDPRIARYTEMFRAKTRQNPLTGQTGLEAEIFTVPRRPQPNQPPRMTFMFDPRPTLMEVPKLK
ncbi:MAG: hypothetical protein O3A00_09825 [Planctomycetota bacterium]|nr:hypothetical protein [Planctomycetota bacterium]